MHWWIVSKKYACNLPARLPACVCVCIHDFAIRIPFGYNALAHNCHILWIVHILCIICCAAKRTRRPGNAAHCILARAHTLRFIKINEAVRVLTLNRFGVAWPSIGSWLTSSIWLSATIRAKRFGLFALLSRVRVLGTYPKNPLPHNPATIALALSHKIHLATDKSLSISYN